MWRFFICDIKQLLIPHTVTLIFSTDDILHTLLYDYEKH